MGLSINDVEIKEKVPNFIPLLSKLTIKFSDFIKNNNSQYIYDGTEKIPFEKRHPIFKALMKIEFESEILPNIN